jgi:hypothetical protein
MLIKWRTPSTSHVVAVRKVNKLQAKILVWGRSKFGRPGASARPPFYYLITGFSTIYARYRATEI